MTELNLDDAIPITFKPKISETDYEKVTLINKVNDLKKKKEIPVINSDDVELMLFVISEFKDASQATRLNLSTGPLKFEKFRECLTGAMRADWDEAREGKPETNAGFDLALTDFIGKTIDEDDFENQKLYLQTVKKPYKMSCSEAYNRLKNISTLMRLFPGAPQGQVYTAMELKTLYFNMMPAQFQLSFKTAGHTLNTSTWPFIVRFFGTVRSAEEKKKAAEKLQQKSKRKERGNDDKNDTGKKSKSKKQKGSRTPKKDCPFHPNQHSWWHCFGNKDGPNYKSDYKLPMPAHMKSKNDRGRDAHAVEETTVDDVVGVVEQTTDFDAAVEELLTELEGTELQE